MKQIINYAFLLTVLAMGFAMNSCGGDDEKENSEVIVPVNPDETEEEDENMYAIVGVWKATYYWKYSGITETITMDVKNNGTLSFTDTDDNTYETTTGSGTWKYDKTTGTWNIKATSSMVSGTYSLIGSQLVNQQNFEDGTSRTITFIKNEGNSDNDYTRLIVGSWEADNIEGVYAYFVFNENGTGKDSDQKVPVDYSNFEYKLDGTTLRCSPTDYYTTDRDEYEIKLLNESELTLKFEGSYGDIYTESFHKISKAPDSYKELLIGTWTVTMSDPSWKCIVTFKENGTFTSKEYYDENGDYTYSSYEGTYSGTYVLSDVLDLSIIPSKDDSVMEFKGIIDKLNSTSGELHDSEGWRMYLKKQ